MNFLKNILKSSQYPIVVAQYERDDYSFDHPEQLHWAIIVLENVKDQKGQCWQAVDRHFRDGQVEWRIAHKIIKLGNTTKCLGGVCIGQVEADQVDDIREVILSHSPMIRFNGWNCRDWIMEVIAVLKNNEFVKYDIPDTQDGYFSLMRTAGQKTLVRRGKGKRGVKIVSFNE
ncbi:hypothetical protein C0992_012226 [Termitomyces sp. T32_za158]|nr:hypothetical protein C0992_012226 [Termitomyces sp. T32_za158]